MKKAVDVEIMGQRFTVKSDAEETHVRQVADYVDEKMQQVLKGARSAGQFHVAMLRLSILRMSTTSSKRGMKLCTSG